MSIYCIVVKKKHYWIAILFSDLLFMLNLMTFSNIHFIVSYWILKLARFHQPC